MYDVANNFLKLPYVLFRLGQGNTGQPALGAHNLSSIYAIRMKLIGIKI